MIAKKYKLCGVLKIIVSSESIMMDKCEIAKCIFLHHLRYMAAFSASQVEIATPHMRRWRNTCIQNNVNNRKNLACVYMYVSVCKNRTFGEGRGEGRQSALRSNACCN